MFSMQEGESEKGSRGKVAEEVILDLALPVQGFEDISDSQSVGAKPESR